MLRNGWKMSLLSGLGNFFVKNSFKIWLFTTCEKFRLPLTKTGDWRPQAHKDEYANNYTDGNRREKNVKRRRESLLNTLYFWIMPTELTGYVKYIN